MADLKNRPLLMIIEFYCMHVQGDQFYMPVLLCYLVKHDMSTVQCMYATYSSGNQCHFLKGTRTTRLCLSGRVVSNIDIYTANQDIRRHV